MEILKIQYIKRLKCQSILKGTSAKAQTKDLAQNNLEGVENSKCALYANLYASSVLPSRTEPHYGKNLPTASQIELMPQQSRRSLIGIDTTSTRHARRAGSEMRM